MPPPPLTSDRPTALDASRAVKKILCEFFAQWFNGTAKALGEEASRPWPSIPAARIVFDQSPQPAGGALVLRIVLLETGQRSGPTPGMAAQGRLKHVRYQAQVWISADTVAGPNDAAEQIATTAGLVRALGENGDSQAQLQERSVRVLAAVDVGAVEQEGQPLHLVNLTLETHYEVLFQQG